MKKTFTLILFLCLLQAIHLQAQQTNKKDTVKKDSAVLKLNEVIINSNKQSNSRETLKINAALKDIPITLNTIAIATLNSQGTDDFQSALRNVSGVNPVETYGGFQQFVIRGFTDFLYLVDGFRDERQNISESAPLSTTAAVDHIDVIKGPASVLFGQSALGGVINIVRKQPSYLPTYDFSVAYGSYNSRRVTIGAGGPITDKLTYRADFGISDQDGWRGAGYSKANGYLVLNYALTPHDDLELITGGNKDVNKLDAGIPTLNGVIPSSIPLSTRYNTPQDHLDYSRADFQLKYDHDFSSDSRLTETISYANDSYQYFSSEELYLTTNKDSVQRGFFNFNTHLKPLQNTIELSSKWKIGSIAQKLTIGNSINYIDWSQTSDGNLPTPTTVAAVNPIETQPEIPLVNDQRHILNEISTAVYLQDLIDFSKKLKGLIGLRYDYFDGKYRHDKLNTSNTFTDGDETNRTSNAVTYRFGLVYEPVKTLSIYGSYSNYFQPVRDIPVNDIVLKPTTGYMGEIGAKVALSEKFSSTTSLYYIAKSNIVIDKGAGILDQAGMAVSKGIEEDLTYRPDVHWSVIAGYSYNDARFTDYIEGGNLNLKGNRLNYAPDNLANLWATYSFPKRAGDNGLNISLGGILTGNSFADNENTVKLPAYTIINGALHYQFKHAELGLNVNNIFNKTQYFVSAINGTQLYPGKPANYLLSLRYKL